jgi:C-terminal processing protease CtpA/Prc
LYVAFLLILVASGAAPGSGRISVAAQSVPDSEGTELDSAAVARLEGIAHVWRTVTHFHPYPAYRDVRWDSATVEAIPAAIAATDSAAYADVIGELLAALADPSTRVVPTAVPIDSPQAGTGATDAQPAFDLTADSIGVVRIEDYRALSDWPRVVGRLREIGGMLRSTRGVVFDLRAGPRPAASTDGTLAFAFSSSGLAELLTSTTIAAPGFRTRIHHGFHPERGATSGGYRSAFETTDRDWIPSRSERNIPSVFLVDRHASLPLEALALRDAGISMILSEGPFETEAFARTHTLSLAHGVRAAVRISELVQEDGSATVLADREIAAPGRDGSGFDPAFQAALELVRRPKSQPRERTPLPPLGGVSRRSTAFDTPYPDLPLRLMAAVRIWATIDLFFPYGALMDRDWGSVFREYARRLASASDAESYHLAVAEMYSHIQDTHGFVNSDVLYGVLGTAPPPIYARWIEGRPVVAGYRHPTAAEAAGLSIGDVILDVDGEDAVSRTRRYARVVAASTEGALMGRATDWMLNGADESLARLTVEGADGRPRLVEVQRRNRYLRFTWRSGDVVRILDDNIGYVDLDRLTVPEVPEMFERLAGTNAIIFDMRGYPNGTAWTIAPYLARVDQAPAAVFDRPLLTGPGEAGRQRYTFVQRIPPRSPDRIPYRGRTVMLVDERTISQAEHTGLFLEAANGTKFVGTSSNGANGDVTNFTVPGGIVLSFTGQSVRHADGRQLQRVGLQPTVTVSPTIEGLRSGQDEVLQAAVRYLLDSDPGR